MEFKLKLSQLWGTTWMIRKFPQDQLTDCEALQKKVNHAGKTSKFYLELCAWFCPCQSRTLQLIETPRRSQQGHPEESRRMSVASTVEPERADREHLRGHKSKGKISKEVKEENRRS